MFKIFEMEKSITSTKKENKVLVAETVFPNDVDLGSVFQNLYVGSNRKKREKKSKSRRSAEMFAKPKSVSQDRGSRLKKSTSEPLLRPPRLLISDKTNKKELDNSEEQCTVTTIDESPCLLRSCGSQHQAVDSCLPSVTRRNSPTLDDTTPDELAAYFDQLLHIPKPMSSMAEMMYT